MLVTSNFSFPSVYYPNGILSSIFIKFETVVCKLFLFELKFVILERTKKNIRYNFFNRSTNKPWFLGICNTSLSKTLWEQEKLLIASNFSFSHSVFYPFKELSVIFIKFQTVVLNLFHFGRV